ncbi:MAG: hypothetical protein ABSH41_05145 [Syntrophobacteraceae bacterium]|jgi:hypothetical protein
MHRHNVFFLTLLFCAVSGLAMASSENTALCEDGKIIVARGHGGHGGGHSHGGANSSNKNSKSNEVPHIHGGGHGSSDEFKWDEAPLESPESSKSQPKRGPETHSQGSSRNLVQLPGEWI